MSFWNPKILNSQGKAHMFLNAIIEALVIGPAPWSNYFGLASVENITTELHKFFISMWKIIKEIWFKVYKNLKKEKIEVRKDNLKISN